MATETEVKEKPIIFSAQMVRAILEGKKTQTRWIVASANSTVLGVAAKPFWKNLYFDHAEKRTQSLTGVMAGVSSDIHLAVPWRHPDDNEPMSECAKYQVRSKYDVGDQLWVRENWQTHCDMDKIAPSDLPPTSAIQYPATYHYWTSKVRPSIHMPRWACRIALEITDVRVERIGCISEADAIAEGAGVWSQTSDCLDSQTMLNRWCRMSVRIAEQRNEPQPKLATVLGAFACLWDSINGKKPGCRWEDSPWVWAITFKRV